MSTDTPVSTHTVALHVIAGRDPGSRARVIVRAMTFALLCLATRQARVENARPAHGDAGMVGPALVSGGSAKR